MIREEQLLQELKDRGYNDISISDVVKNGVTLRSLTIRENGSRISPCIYIDSIINDHDDVSAAADFIENIYTSHKSFDLGCDVEDLTNPEFIKDRVYIGLQKSSNQSLIKRDSIYEGIEQFLYIRGNNTDDGGRWSVKLNPQMIQSMDLNELWDLGEEHTFSEFSISTMQEVLANLIGEDELSIGDEIPMYIVSNKDKINGAACACDVDHIRTWAHEKGFTKLCVLPSSTSEMILVPVSDESFNLEEMCNMVKEVNETQVQPQERLTDRAYLLDVA